MLVRWRPWSARLPRLGHGGPLENVQESLAWTLVGYGGGGGWDLEAVEWRSVGRARGCYGRRGRVEGGCSSGLRLAGEGEAPWVGVRVATGRGGVGPRAWRTSTARTTRMASRTPGVDLGALADDDSYPGVMQGRGQVLVAGRGLGATGGGRSCARYRGWIRRKCRVRCGRG